MAYEDFKNDYTEVDAGTFINADTVDTRANFVNMNLLNDSYFYKDFGVGHFANYTHLIEFYLDAAPGTGVALCGYSVGTTYDDLAGQGDAFQAFMYGMTGGAGTQIRIKDASDGNYDFYAISLDTSYYLKCIRNGTTWSVEIYSDSSRETLLDTIAVTGTVTAFQYVLAAQSDNEAGGARDITGYMEDLDLQEADGLSPTGVLRGPLGGPLFGPIM